MSFTEELTPENPQTIGLVHTYYSNYYTVEVNDVYYSCFVKGNLKKQNQDVLVGDWVQLDSLEPAAAQARIIGVLPRSVALSRPKIANVNCLLVVHSLKEPEFEPQQLDRYLTRGALSGLKTIICISKADLNPDLEARQPIIDLYEKQLGYPVVFTSIHDLQSLARITELVKGHLTVLAGLSGTGKSSLINQLTTTVSLKIGAVSEKISRGQHTTRHVMLIPLDKQTYVADTPGFSLLKFDKVLPAAIEATFPELQKFKGQCGFEDCLHQDEPDCAVLADPGNIAPSRLASYKAMIAEASQYAQEIKSSSQKEDYGTKIKHGKNQQDVQIMRLKAKSREGSRKTLRQELQENLQMLVDQTPDSL